MATSADYKLGEFSFARGWFAVANSNEIGRKPTNIHYFGQDMVIYRGTSGRVIMLDAWCPHMGTKLGSGETSATTTDPSFMEGDNIRCPFHAWRFGADGKCNHIPYYDGPIPPGARLKTWHVVEKYGIVFTWHDPEGLEPEFDLIDFPEWNDPQWVRWEGLEPLCDLNHPIEIFDNMSDVAHLGHLHGGRAVEYENEYDRHLMHQRQRSAVEDNSSGLFGSTYSTVAGYVGPGIAFGRFQEMGAAQIICVTPIDDGTCRAWQTAMVRSPSGVVDEAARAIRAKASALFGGGLLRDGEVWKVKRPAIHIIQLPTDGPFRESRTWYSQFFNPRSKAAEIVGRVTGVHHVKGWPPYTPEAVAAE